VQVGQCQTAGATLLMPVGQCQFAVASLLVPVCWCHFTSASLLMPVGRCYITGTILPVPLRWCQSLGTTSLVPVDDATIFSTKAQSGQMTMCRDKQPCGKNRPGMLSVFVSVITSWLLHVMISV